MYKIYYSPYGADILKINDDSNSIEFISRKTLQGFESINQFEKNGIENFIAQNVDKKICFYGAGKTAVDILSKLTLPDNVIAVFDRDPKKTECAGLQVFTPDKIEAINPDIIIITALYSADIEKYLINYRDNKSLKFDVFSFHNLPDNRHELPKKVINKWAEFSKINPLTCPSSGILANSRYAEVESFEKDFEYCIIEKRLKEEYSHIFLINSLLTGGSEKVTINYLNAINEINPNKKVLLITTMDNPPVWLDKLPNNTSLLSLGSLYKIDYEKALDLLLCILMEAKSDKLHILNSCMAYDLLDKSGYGLAKKYKIFDSQWCINVTHEGFYCDFPIKHVNPDILTGLFSENQNYYKYLKSIHNFPEEKYKVHYQPVEIKESIKTDVKIQDKLNILWASRICRQKRPDILLKIAECCKYLPVHFHIWGRVPEAYDISELEQENITYHGEFTEFNFSNLDYDLFLYTAETDGMPNVILEAIAARIPILTSNAGGIKEIAEGCALIIKEHDNVLEYCNHIISLLDRENIELKKNRTELAFQSLLKQHSWEKFVNSVKKEIEYV